MLHDPLDQLQLHLPHLLPRPVRVGSLGVGLPADVRAWDSEKFVTTSAVRTFQDSRHHDFSSVKTFEEILKTQDIVTLPV